MILFLSTRSNKSVLQSGEKVALLDRNKVPLQYIDVKALNCIGAAGINTSEKLNRAVILLLVNSVD